MTAIFRMEGRALAVKFSMMLALLVMVGGSGCSSVGPASNRRPPSTGTHAPAAKVITNKPKQRPTTLQKLNPVFWVGNLDDPQPPDWYRPHDAARSRKWYCRNSLHNFTFYVIGIADKEFEHKGRFPGELFNPHGGWNWTVCRYHWLRLPLISYQSRRVRFYVGWRTRGNFGIKFNLREVRSQRAQ